ncbi:MAG TPA: HprK-related kinase A [Burkholderiaceae bacterium]
MRIADLEPRALRAALHGEGLRFRMGPFSVCVRTRLRKVVEGIALLYGDYELLGDDAYIDFSVALDCPFNLHTLIGPQVRFLFDGAPAFLPLPLAQAFPMFEWGLNWCVSAHANDYLIVHAAVVERDGLCAILPAPPGSGKSTLCATLIHRGWRLLSDELTLIQLRDRMVVPLPRPVSLKNASIGIVRNYVPGVTVSSPVSDTVKGTVAQIRPPADSLARDGEACRAGWIVFPRYVAGSLPVLDAMPRSRAFMEIADNAFNYSLLGAAGFDALADVVDGARCFTFSYSQLDDAVAAFDNLAAERHACV